MRSRQEMKYLLCIIFVVSSLTIGCMILKHNKQKLSIWDLSCDHIVLANWVNGRDLHHFSKLGVKSAESKI